MRNPTLEVMLTTVRMAAMSVMTRMATMLVMMRTLTPKLLALMPIWLHLLAMSRKCVWRCSRTLCKWLAPTTNGKGG